MIVPQYWAEGRVQHRKAGKQITVRRFGWSDASQVDAQANADQRTAEALQRLLSGEKLDRREPKIPYNGADGVPIREEILGRRGETIITRNSYGAQCLNTPNVLFADVDFEKRPAEYWTILIILTLLVVAVMTGWVTHNIIWGVVVGVIGIVVAEKAGALIHRATLKSPEEDYRIAREKIRIFSVKYPDWNLALYRTPAGVRILVTHRVFAPGEPTVSECFEALGTDRLYKPDVPETAMFPSPSQSETVAHRHR